MKTATIVLAICAFPAFAHASECDWLVEAEVEQIEPAAYLMSKICECNKFENGVARLDCFDTLAKASRLMELQALARAEQLSRMPGGIEAMRRKLEETD